MITPVGSVHPGTAHRFLYVTYLPGGATMAGDSKCPNCAQTGWGKKKCNHCGHLACGKSHPQPECKVCKKGKMRDI